MMDAIQGNKLIAEFMGHNNGDVYELFGPNNYDLSWNELMPVVEKIGELSPYIIHERGMRISDAGITYKSPVSLIDAVWNGVTLYIQWYNKNKKQ